jgi:integrase/recombinase XerD
MTDTEVTPPTFNARIMVLRFLFGTTCDREDMKRYTQFRTQPRRLPIVPRLVSAMVQNCGQRRSEA